MSKNTDNKIKRNQRKKSIVRMIIYLFVWSGIAVSYYIIFSLFFDTPLEYELKKSNRFLNREYEELSERYDSLNIVLQNIIDRDKNVYGLLFETDPYMEQQSENTENIDILMKMSNSDLAKIFFDKLNNFQKEINSTENKFISLQDTMINLSNKLNYIPSIQPVANHDLTKLAASYGMRIHPFLKNLTSHQGVDFAVPEDTRIFASADGVVSEVANNAQGLGLNVILDHGNGYKTLYANLNKAVVGKGKSIKRGDIIAYSGNSGLSFMPHLHYEVIYKNMRVDPINYFFYELNPASYNRIQEIAKISMQSLD